MNLALLIRVAIIAVIAILIFQLLAGGGTPPDLSPEVLSGNVTDILELPDPISAFTTARIDGDEFLLVMTKFGDDRLEPALLHVVRINEAGGMEVVNSLETPIDVEFPPAGIAFAGAYAYAGLSGVDRGDPALWVVSLEDPETPTTEMLIETDMVLRSLAVSDESLLIAAGLDTRFLVFDVATGESPAVLGEFDVAISTAPDIDLDGSRLFIDHMAGVIIMEINNPLDPRVLARIDHHDWQIPAIPPASLGLLTDQERFDIQIPERNFLDFALDSGILAIAASDHGLLLYDLMDQPGGEPDGSLSFDGRAVSVELNEHFAYVLSAAIHEETAFAWTLHGVDIREPTTPELVGRVAEITGPFRFQRLVLINDQLFLLFNDTIISLEPD